MPTVKIQNGKVILKDGKVSCTCCEGCCMYPAEGLGVTYDLDDLPDAITAFGSDLQKRTSGFPGSEFANVIVGYLKEGAPEYGDYAIVRNSEVLDNWQVWSFDNDEWDRGAGFGGVGNCLIQGDGNLTPGNDIVEDQFADCYEVTWDDDGTRSAIVQRASLCVWEGIDFRDQPVVLFYSDTLTKWGVEVVRGAGNDEFNPDNRTKDSDQSAPDAGDGEYGGFIVEEIECP
jgi:hypothetical protein